MSSLTSTMNSDSICCSEHQNVKKKISYSNGMYCIARTVFKNSLLQDFFNQTVFSLSLRPSKQRRCHGYVITRTERY